MKRTLLSLTLLVVACVFFACKKDDAGGQTTFPVTVTTAGVTDVSGTGAKSGGEITSSGEPDISARGVCWGTAENPTTVGSKTSDGTGKGQFTSSLTGLAAGTKYYVRAYAVQGSETTYGNQVSFIAGLAVTTGQVTGVTESTAVGSGTAILSGGGTVTEAGLCWNTSGNPTLDDSNTIVDPESDGTFTIDIPNLLPNTTYYVRAFASTAAGTTYGTQVSFKTSGETVVTITDAAFKAYLLQNFDVNHDGQMQQSEARLVTEINIAGLGTVASLEGIKSFTNLRKLTVNDLDSAVEPRNTIASIDLGGLDRLEELYFTKSGTTSINLAGCTALHTMHGLFNSFASIDVSTCAALQHMHLNENTALTSVNFGTATTKLVTLGLINTRVAQIDLTGRADLTELWGGVGAVQSINVTGCTSLSKLIVNENVQLTTLTGLNTCTGLVEANLVNTRLTAIAANGCSNLARLYIGVIPTLTSVNVTGCTALNVVAANVNPLLTTITGLNTCANLIELNVFQANLNSLDVTGCGELSKLWAGDNRNLGTITGLGTCVKLDRLEVFLTAIASLNVTGCVKLEGIYAGTNANLTSVTGLGTCTVLNTAEFFETGIPSLDVTGCTALDQLFVNATPIATLTGLNTCTNLRLLFAQQTKLTSLAPNNAKLAILHCWGNSLLTTLDLTNCPILVDLFADNIGISTLDVSRCAMAMNFLIAHSCPSLTTLTMKTGQTVGELNINTPPTNIVRN